MAYEPKGFDIKSVKPRKGKISQGYFVPANRSKYMGDVTEIIYRSNWELKFLKYLDTTEKVKKYSSEPFFIPYYDPITKKVKKYFIDFLAIMTSEEGKDVTWLIEVKPKKFILKPKYPKKETIKSLSTFEHNYKQWLRNQYKFEAAKNYAKEKGWKFGLITEGFVFKESKE